MTRKPSGQINRRKERLGAALRENLKRRKAQARGRAALHAASDAAAKHKAGNEDRGQ